MNEYWLSWTTVFEDDGKFELHSPWWTSGWCLNAEEQEESVINAAVRADSEDQAWEKVAAAYEIPPEGGVNKRFIHHVKDGDAKPWERAGTRFVIEDWMEW